MNIIIILYTLVNMDTAHKIAISSFIIITFIGDMTQITETFTDTTVLVSIQDDLKLKPLLVIVVGRLIIF